MYNIAITVVALWVVGATYYLFFRKKNKSNISHASKNDSPSNLGSNINIGKPKVGILFSDNKLEESFIAAFADLIIRSDELLTNGFMIRPTANEDAPQAFDLDQLGHDFDDNAPEETGEKLSEEDKRELEQLININ